MKIAYLDCFSGISGDMVLGALLDAGLSSEDLKERLESLPLDGYQIEISRETRNQICGTRFVVKSEGKEQPPRNQATIREIIEHGDLNGVVKEKSIEIFEELARAEGKVHNLAPEEVHFHEIGAIDSIIDIVGTVYGIDRLGVSSLFCSPLPLGSGFADTAHSRIPIPAPATIAILEGIPVYDSGIPFEMVTPTGAALVKGLASSFGAMPSMVIQKAGYGVGTRDLPDRPNLVRVLIGKQQFEQEVDTVVVLDTNTDDISPEWMGYIMDRLFEAGALDVVFCPVQMKKNRPGVQIQVIGRPDQRDALMEILFSECATLGIRFRYSQRTVLRRSIVEINSPWGKIRAKKVVNTDGSSSFLPEYEVCRAIALNNNLPLREVFAWVVGLNRE
ncbi:MAG: nickel pincer cofactor biosynthesis protein LarC [Thermodesulfobacteriota bacterium]|nr:nickel pincer cofactor biosynthesis protein LarC [Thermodesulfobacteriota bacterium]